MIPTVFRRRLVPAAALVLAALIGADVRPAAAAAPVAVFDYFNIAEADVLQLDPASLLGNDSDPDGDALAIVIVTSPANGVLIDNLDGSFAYDPNPGFNGADQFTYQATDGTELSNMTSVTIVVNSPPVAVDDAYTTPVDTPVVIAAPGVFGNDSDADGTPLTASLNYGGTFGTLAFNADGSFEYTPPPGYQGIDGFGYEACDIMGCGSLAHVLITIGTPPAPPVAVDDAFEILQDSPTSIFAPGVLANDSDINGDAMTSSPVTQPAHGNLVMGGDGGFYYAPEFGFTGVDTFTYWAGDGVQFGNVATVTLNVLPASGNQPPVANDDEWSIGTGSIGVGAPGVLVNDVDPDGDPMTAELLDAPAHGTLTFNADGSFFYETDQGFTGTDGFTYQAFDGNDLSNVATVTFTVDNPPFAADDAHTTPADTPLVVPTPGVLANDGDADGDPITAFPPFDGPFQGTLSFNGADGSFTYTPDAGFQGIDVFYYTVYDGKSASNPAAVVVTVGAGDVPPTAVDDAYAVEQNGTLAMPPHDGVLANDSDPNGDPFTAGYLDLPAHGTLTPSDDGSFAYEPDTGFTGVDGFTYQAWDEDGASNVAAVTITVNETAGPNQPPVANDDEYDLPTDQQLTVDGPGVLANDADPEGDPLAAELVSDPSFGTLTLNGDGSFIYQPDAGFQGLDTFDYLISDGDLSSDVATVFVHVDNRPVAADDLYQIAVDQGLTVPAPGVLGNDTDADGDPLTAMQNTFPAHGTLLFNDADGSFVYNPDPGFAGVDSFQYQPFDGVFHGPSALVTIVVGDQPANQLPLAEDDAYQTERDTALSIPAPGLLANDSDPDGDALTLLGIDAALLAGTVAVDPNGAFLFTPDPGFIGTTGFVYFAQDGNGGEDEGHVTIKVTAGPGPSTDPPPDQSSDADPTLSPDANPPAAEETAKPLVVTTLPDTGAGPHAPIRDRAPWTALTLGATAVLLGGFAVHRRLALAPRSTPR